MDVKLAAAVLGAVRNREVAGFCRLHGISRQTFYKWRNRALTEGQAGLEERSRRPLRSPGRTSDEMEDAVVRARKELDDAGDDNGAWSIRQRLLAEYAPKSVPSESTIWRVLTRRGLIVAAPKKRPKVSLHRFVYPRPNDCWQIDATHWDLANGTTASIINIIDDHSRVCVASVAVAACTSVAAWNAFTAAGALWGLPARVLSDNGLAFNGSRRGFNVLFETNVRTAGVYPIASTPFHPQTCGKVERFHQTMKTWLAKQPPARSLRTLQTQLDRFIEHYNQHRPHRSLHGKTPTAIWTATPRAVPADHPVTATTTVERAITVTANGNVRIDHRYQINIGVEYAGLAVDVITTGLDCIIFWNNELVRSLQIDPTRSYQPSRRTRGPAKGQRRKPRLRQDS
jgi:transposase InsO family protein